MGWKRIAVVRLRRGDLTFAVNAGFLRFSQREKGKKRKNGGFTVHIKAGLLLVCSKTGHKRNFGLICVTNRRFTRCSWILLWLAECAQHATLWQNQHVLPAHVGGFKTH